MGVTKDALDELNKFSLSVPLDLYREQYGECILMFKGVGLEKLEGG